jgi:parallel beta-helix repeat protein
MRTRFTILVVFAMVLSVVPTAWAADPPPFIHVSITEDWIEFFNFTPGPEPIDVSVDGAGLVAVEAESDRFVVGFEFDFEGGQTVVAEQGLLRAEVVLVELSINPLDGVNASGSGPPDANLWVEVVGDDCPYGEHSTKEVTTDLLGDWATDFEVECPDGLGGGYQGSVFYFDTEGDATIAQTSSDEVEPEEVESDLTLTEDHEGGFVIVEDNVTLDCDGHRIHGEGGFGVLLPGRSGVTVKNCVVEGFYSGVLLEESHGNTIKNNVSVYPIEHGFALELSDGNTVAENRAVSSTSHGWVLLDSDNNRLSDNSGSSDGGHAGFHILGSSGNSITGNSIEGYAFGFTIESGPWVDIFHGSDHNTISTNELRNNEVIGFFLAKADGNVLSENLVLGSIYGIGLGAGAAGTPEAINNKFVENVIRDTEIGYVNFWNTTGNRVSENSFCHNAEHIDYSNDTETTFEENKFCGPDK